MSTSDHELMTRLADGDSEALAVLIRRWEGGVARVLVRLVPNSTDVDDLRQEVFLRVLSASSRYQAKGEFSIWLYRIVVNLARDAARRRKLRSWLPLTHHHLANSNGAPQDSCSQREVVEVVEEALTQLPDRLREVLVLKHYSDMTFAEVAAALDEPVTTIKSRTQSALRRLHRELAQRGVGEEELET